VSSDFEVGRNVTCEDSTVNFVLANFLNFILKIMCTGRVLCGKVCKEKLSCAAIWSSQKKIFVLEECKNRCGR